MKPPTFGRKVVHEAAALLAGGKDPNQIANILFQRDKAGRNYGIGIILDGRGKPAKTSTTLLRAARKELADSNSGSYRNSAKSMDALKDAVLAWQGIPNNLARHFHLAIPSDAGTGAVQTALQSALLLDPKIKKLGFETMSWPAYKTIANILRVETGEFALGAVSKEKGVLPIYQAGPHNSTGRTPQKAEVEARAKSARGWVVLDRAYSGFEYASQLGTISYPALMRRSYETQIKPFIDAGVPFFLAVSPTKAFVTFALRPCGLLLAFCPDRKTHASAPGAFNTAIRARGSAFEHPVTRAFIHAMIHDAKGLRRDHEKSLARVAAAERGWKRLAAGTPLEAVFNDRFAGLFRNVRVREGAEAALYNEHLYPVFTPGRCRLNVTGLPANAKEAARDAATFARYCLD